MADAKHTPGPWVAVSVGGFGEYEIHARGKDIAAVNVSDGMDEPTPFPAEANARLIAAAPDLLAALQNLMTPFGSDIERRAPALFKNMRAAIAKAGAA